MGPRAFGRAGNRGILLLACVISAMTIAYPFARPELPVAKIIQLNAFVRKERAALDVFKD